jgi:ABC-type sugar transport system ATPase subunit
MLRIHNLSGKFGDFKLNHIDLHVATGEYFVLLGPSGAGKSLLFEMIAGIYKPDKGEIFLDGKNITGLPPDKRNIGLVFQDNTLFPNLNVFSNIGYPLRPKIKGTRLIKEEVERLAGSFSIQHLLHRDLQTLSGGEIQRVSLARALARKPLCLLLDEPVSSLDIQLREGILELLKELNRNGQTIVHITHHLNEAVRQAGRLAIIDGGRIIREGSPSEIYKDPGSAFVADFLGYKNVYGFTRISAGKIRIDSGLELSTASDMPESGKIIFPDYAISLLIENIHGQNTFPGIVTGMTEYPEYTELKLSSGFPLIKRIANDSGSFAHGQQVFIRIDTSKVIFQQF